MYSIRGMMYMFEFIVEDLIIAHPNHCAPVEFTTSVEINFRNNVYLNICDSDYFGLRVKRGKRCIFTVLRQITEDDRLIIQVSKKRKVRNQGNIKFILGTADAEVKSLFDTVDTKFKNENIDWYERRQNHLMKRPTMDTEKKSILDNCECYEVSDHRYEEMTPIFEKTKRLVPLFNLCQKQTGNILMIISLHCLGPSIMCFTRTMPTPPPPRFCPFDDVYSPRQKYRTKKYSIPRCKSRSKSSEKVEYKSGDWKRQYLQMTIEKLTEELYAIKENIKRIQRSSRRNSAGCIRCDVSELNIERPAQGKTRKCVKF